MDPAEDEQIAHDGCRPEHQEHDQPRPQQVARQKPVGFGQRGVSGDAHAHVDGLVAPESEQRREPEDPGLAFQPRPLQRPFPRALDRLDDRPIRRGLSGPVAGIRITGEHQPRGVGDGDHRARREPGLVGELGHPTEIHLGEHHRPRCAAAVDGGVRECQHRLAGGGIGMVPARGGLPGGQRALEERLIGHVHGAVASPGRAEDMPIRADRPYVRVEREPALDLREQGAARLGVVHLHVRQLREADEQRSRAFEQPLMIGRGEPRQAERVLLRAHGGLSPLFPGRPQDERERRQHGQQDHEEQAVAQASEREAPHHGSPVSAHVRRSAGDRATNAPNQEPRTPVSRGAAARARPGACRLHSGRGRRTGSRRPGPVARTIDSVPRDGLLWTSPIGGASMAPSETFPMGQAEPGKPAPESGRGASTAPLPALPAGPRLPRRARVRPV